MQEFLHYVLTKITRHPDSVTIAQEEDEESIRFHITVHPDDAGLVIGKEGKVINSLRNLLKTQTTQEKRVYLDLTNEKPATMDSTE